MADGMKDHSNLRHSGIGMTSLRTRRRLVQRLRDQGIHDERVLDAIEQVPRHIFLDEALASRAYEDTSLPIGYNQTISQPYVVAKMTEALLAQGPLGKVLEIGTGSGYQAAVAAVVAREVYTVERIRPLMNRAMSTLFELRIRNVHFRHADGGDGWPAHAPYDAILVTAAPADIPEALLAQLAPGGRMVIPVGNERTQELLRITRNDSEFSREHIELVTFVPMIPGAT